MANAFGDAELDLRDMRVLAHPVRLALLRRLQQDGPSTATRLARSVGATPTACSWHLRQLASRGLVDDAAEAPLREHGRERWWQASARGFRFAHDGSAEASEAASALITVMEELDGDVVGTWRADVEASLEPEWRQRSGRISTVLVVTPDELDMIRAVTDQLLRPFVLRKYQDTDSTPRSARRVRLLRYVMPELEGVAEVADGVAE